LRSGAAQEAYANGTKVFMTECVVGGTGEEIDIPCNPHTGRPTGVSFINLFVWFSLPMWRLH